MQNQFLKVKNSLLELEKDFTGLKNIELKEIGKLFDKPIIMSKDDMEKFEEHEMKKITPIIRNWFDQLIKQSVIGKKPITITDKLRDKIINDI